MTVAGLQRAEILLARRDLPAAIAAFNDAENTGAAADSCAGGRWMAYMLCGNFAAAWRESDAILRRDALDPHRFWLGQDLRSKRIIVRCLHGYGDAVQFLRYVPRLRVLASHVVVEVPPAVVEIAPCLDGVDDVITWGAAAPAVAPAWDVQVEVTELPYIFRTGADELPLAVGYLHLPETVRLQAEQAMGCSKLPRVGIVWAAGDWDAGRSVPLTLLQPVLQASGCEFWSLQGGAAADQWTGLHDAACCGEGILRLAAAIYQLDLVITVDTLAAHLAGALGKPAWVMLQNAADWRWMTGRSDSLWYPSLRLFRQPEPGDWVSTVRSIACELTQWMLGKAA